MDADAAGDRGAAVELLICNSMWSSGRGTLWAVDDHAVLLWSCCSAAVCGPAGGCERWMGTLWMTTRCCCGAAVLQLYVVPGGGGCERWMGALPMTTRCCSGAAVLQL